MSSLCDDTGNIASTTQLYEEHAAGGLLVGLSQHSGAKHEHGSLSDDQEEEDDDESQDGVIMAGAGQSSLRLDEQSAIDVYL
jgi:hypothetical protein